MLFDRNGNLHETIFINYEEFKRLFGINEWRRELLTQLLYFLKLFKQLGCTSVYIAGSFVTQSRKPHDIDVCIDITYVNYKKLKTDYPELIQEKHIEKIRKEHKIHFALFFDFASYELLDFFKKDRDDNPKGLVKINLYDIERYD